MALRYWVLIGLLGAIWGCSFLFNAVLIRELGPLWVSAGRIAIGAAGCWVFYVATGKRGLPRDPTVYAQLLLLGLVNYAIPFALFPFAEQELSSGLVAVLNGLTPMTTVIVSQFWPGGDRTTWNKSVGVVIGFIGAAVLASPSLGENGSGQLLAIGACLVATLLYAFALNYARRFRGLDSATTAACSLTAAALLMVPTALVFEGVPVVTRLETVGALLGIGLMSTTLAFLLLWWLLPRVGPTNLSLNTYIIPISALLLGIFVLHEKFLPIQFLGIAIVCIGLVFLDGRLFRIWKRTPA